MDVAANDDAMHREEQPNGKFILQPFNEEMMELNQMSFGKDQESTKMKRVKRRYVNQSIETNRK